MKECLNCRAPFRPSHSVTRLCSRTCWLAWKRRPENRERERQKALAQWADPAHTAMRLERLLPALRSDENRKRCSEENRRRWSDPFYAAKVTASQMRARASAEFRKRAAETMTERWTDAEWKEKTSQSMRGVKKGDGLRTPLLKLFIAGGLSLKAISEETDLPVSHIEDLATRRGWWPR